MNTLSTHHPIQMIFNYNNFHQFNNLYLKSQKAKDLNLDIVLINAQSSPAICKAVNYKEEIYSRFAKEIINEESESRKVDSKKPKKQIQITVNISSADLKTKAQIAKDISRKSPQLKIFIQTNDAQEEQGKNILYTFKDLVKDSLISEHDLVVRSLLKDDMENEDLFNDKKATKQIELHLQTNEFKSTQTKYTPQQIKKLVDQYLKDNRVGMKEDPAAEELKKSSKILKQLEKYDSSNHLISDKTLDEQIKQYGKDIKDEEIDENADTYFAALEELSKYQKRTVHEIQDEVDVLRQKLQASKEHALFYSLLQKEQKRLRDYKRTLKLIKQVKM